MRVVLRLSIAAVVGVGAFFVFQKLRSNQPTDALATLAPDPQSAVAFILPVSQTNYLPIRDFNVADPQIDAKSVVLFDTHSDRFLYQKNANQKLPIASLTKLMTAVVVLENLDLNSTVTISTEDVNVDGLGADFAPNEQLRAGDLLRIMLVKSSNDAASAFQSAAEKQGIDFVLKMNSKAAELGMNSTHFTNPSGLDDSAFSSAGDLVKLVQYALKYPLIWQILRLPSFDATSVDGVYHHHVVTTDQLLGKLTDLVGGKTGYTDGALGTLIIVVNVDGGQSQMIGVVLGSTDRFGAMQKLISWGQQAYSWK